MTFKQIETAREVRLWIAQIVVPAATAVVVAMSVPEVRHAITVKVDGVKTAIKNKFNKEGA